MDLHLPRTVGEDSAEVRDEPVCLINPARGSERVVVVIADGYRRALRGRGVEHRAGTPPRLSPAFDPVDLSGEVSRQVAPRLSRELPARRAVRRGDDFVSGVVTRPTRAPEPVSLMMSPSDVPPWSSARSSR